MKELDLYDMIEKQVSENLNEKFGFIFNTSKIDSLQVGDVLELIIPNKITPYKFTIDKLWDVSVVDVPYYDTTEVHARMLKEFNSLFNVLFYFLFIKMFFSTWNMNIDYISTFFN